VRATRYIFMITASLPVSYSFCLYMTHFDIMHSYVLMGVVTFPLLLLMERSPKAAIIAVFTPVVLALYFLLFRGNPVLILDLGIGYLLASPIVMFFSSVTQSPREMLTSYLFSYSTALLILVVVMAGGTDSLSFSLKFGGFLVNTVLQRVVPFYPEGGFGPEVGLLAIPTAMGAVGMVFLIASSHDIFDVELKGYTRMIKAALLSIVFTSIITFVSAESPNMTGFIVAISALALALAVFYVSRRA